MNMKKKCFIALVAMAFVAAALAFVACKNIEDGGEIQPPAPEQSAGGNGGANQGGEQNPGQGENPGEEENPGQGENPGGESGGEQSPGEGENPEQGENPGGEEGEENPQPDNPTTKAVSDLLKEIIGEAEYNAISAKAASGNLTFAAESVKAVYDFFPVLEKYAEAGKEASEVQNASIISQNKEAFVAQAEGEIEIKLGPVYPDWYEMYPESFNEDDAEKKCTVKYKKNFAFEGVFNLDEIQFEKTDGAQGNFTGATLKGEEISIDKLNTIRGDSLPTLSFSNVTVCYSFLEGFSAEETNFYLYKLYKDYSDNLGKLEISGNMSGIAVNAAKDKDGNFINGYTLFTDDDKAKLSTDTSIKSLPVDALIQMYEQLCIHFFANMIISGKPKEATEVVNWNLTNIVFEGDMSDIENDKGGGLIGIVYFKDKPYNNIDRSSNSYQSMYGLLKLDSLNGVSYNTFGINLSSNSAVLDVRGVDRNFIDNNYNKNAENYGIVAGNGYSHAIYFSKDFNDIKNSQSEINDLCYKFSRFPGSGAGFVNAYFGEDRVNSESYNELRPQSIIGAKNPRKLKEFEYFGNYFENTNGFEGFKFEKTAKDTYGNDFEKLSIFDKANLEKYLDEIAQTNKKCIKAKSFV